MRFNLFLTIDLNLLTLGFLSLNFSLLLIRNISRRKKIEFWCKSHWLIDLLSEYAALQGSTTRPFCRSFARRIQNKSRFFFPLYRSYARARAPVKRYFLFVSIREVLYSASSGSSLWARTLRGQNQRQGPITNGLLPTSSMRSDSMSTNCS